ncbi:MAG: NAD(P)H-dependent glycerol-3-phosphate dehydrogenase [Clostridia bacterium]|nr:NAD(P)H-dependent glycerol-3-phosphate dehydrogenase [Clostridia bacterium]
MKISCIGAGSWGTALALTLADKDNEISIWDRDENVLKTIEEKRENRKYLPGVKIPENIIVKYDMEQAFEGAEMVLFAVPAQAFRSAFEKAIPYLDKKVIIVNVAKGIEQGSLMRLSEIAEELFPACNYVCLSGPSHAEEVGRKLPTTVTVASRDRNLAKKVQDIFNTLYFRVYRHDDIIGVELGGALKNIIALGIGIAEGMKFGDNAKAAMMTRGITEMMRLGIKLGAKVETFAGLSGVGDLIVTCTSMHSRNFRCGILIGKGIRTSEAVKEIGMVVEGINTVEAAYALARKLDVDMPIVECIYAIVHDEMTAEEAVETLMTRDTKAEMRM